MLFPATVILTVSLVCVGCVFSQQTVAPAGKSFQQNHGPIPSSIQAQLISSGFSKIFWDYVEIHNFSDGVSPECLRSLISVQDSLENGDSWAFKFLDDSGKTPSNFLDGTYAAFGNYDSCLAIASKSGLRGQYCLASLLPETHSHGNEFVQQIYPHHFDIETNLTIKAGFCVPSSCSQFDVDFILNQALGKYSWRLVEINSCEVSKTFINGLQVAPKAQKIALLLLITLVLTVFIATGLEYHHRSNGLKWPSTPPGLFWLGNFSLFKSYRSLLRKPDLKPRLYLLDSLRLVLLIAVLSSHAFMWFTVLQAPFLLEQTRKAFQLSRKFWAQLFINDWGTEFLIYLGGLSASVNLLHKMKPETPILTYSWEIFRRALLLLPPVLVVVGLEIVLPLVGSGPFYQSVNQYRSHICSKSLWHVIFHVHNRLPAHEICVPHTWSIAAEFHLFALATVTVLLYKRHPRCGTVFNLWAIIGGLVHVARTFYGNNLLPQMIISRANFRDMVYRMGTGYIATGSHIWSYMLALFIVKIMADHRESHISKQTRSQILLVLATLSLIQSFSSSLWNTFDLKIDPLLTGFYVLSYKTLTGLLFAFLTFTQGEKFRKFFKSGSNQNTKNGLSSNGVNGLTGLTTNNNNTNGNGSKDNVNTNITNNNIETQGLDNQSDFAKDLSSSRNRSKLKRLHRFEIFFRLTKASYFTHSIVYAWYFSSLRSTLPFEPIHWVSMVVFLVAMAYVAGFIFHLFALGPFDSIVYSLKTKSKSKLHRS